MLRQPVVCHVLANTAADLRLGLLAADRSAAITLVTLTPTLQLEHVRIQT